MFRVGLAFVVALAGCSAGRTGASDAGIPTADTGGAPDAARPFDASARADAGTAIELLGVPCDDDEAAVYAALAGTEPLGAILACHVDGFVDEATLALRLGRAGILDIAPRGGFFELRVAFRTTRRGGAAAVSSARVLVPANLARTPSPGVVTAHPTAGLADACAPSRTPGQGDALALGWVASGWPVIAPDYAGLGTAGTQGYGDNDDTARSVLDAGRALAALLAPGTLGDDLVVVGHSQGGGVAISAQALERSYGTHGRIALAVGLAPGWPGGASADPLRDPSALTSGGSGLPVAVYSMFLYAWFARELGEGSAGDGFASGVRDDVVTAMERDCVTPLGGSLASIVPTWGGLVDPIFAAQLIACADGGPCLGNAARFWSFLESNRSSGDPSGAPVLLHAGTADTVTPAEDVACVERHLEADGVSVGACLDASTHFDIVARSASHLVAYAEAIVSGSAPPVCPTSMPLPVCP